MSSETKMDIDKQLKFIASLLDDGEMTDLEREKEHCKIRGLIATMFGYEDLKIIFQSISKIIVAEVLAPDCIFEYREQLTNRMLERINDYRGAAVAEKVAKLL